jgi:isopenicillin N synthase-like dioxygenase
MLSKIVSTCYLFIVLDKWVSTLHRVILPPAGEERVVGRRQSIAFFCNINGDAIVEPIETCRTARDSYGKYPPITAKEYLMTKHLASMAASANTNDDEL